MSDEITTSYTPEQIADAVRTALQPLRIYDPVIDAYRPVTQADVDRLTAIAAAFGRISMTVKDIKEETRAFSEAGRP